MTYLKMTANLQPQYEYLYVFDSGDLLVILDDFEHEPRKVILTPDGDFVRIQLIDSWPVDSSYNNYIPAYLPLPGLPAGSIVMIEPEPSLISKITTYFKEVLKEL